MACYGCINPNNACDECKRNIQAMTSVRIVQEYRQVPRGATASTTNQEAEQMTRTYRLIQLPGGIITEEWEGRPLPLNARVLETGLTITEAMDKSRHHRRQRELNKAFNAK